MTVCELCEKFVINLASGGNLGRVDDVEFSPDTAQITHLVIYGKPRLFGLLGRGESVRIAWPRIRTIGRDAVLVEDAAENRSDRSQLRIWKFGGT